MEGIKKSTRLVALTLVILILGNFCDFRIFEGLFSKTEVSAAQQLTYQNIKDMWFANKGSYNLDNESKPTNAFWKDTSSLKTAWVDTDSEDVTVYDKAEDALDKSLGTLIKLNDGETTLPTKEGTQSVSECYFRDNVETKQPIAYIDEVEGTTETTTFANNYNVSGIPEINDDEKNAIYYTLEYDKTSDGYYRKYYVSTANQLQYILFVSQSEAEDVMLDDGKTVLDAKNGEGIHSRAFVETTAGEIKQVYGVENGNCLWKFAIELLCDIDLGGANDQYWVGYSNNTASTGDGRTRKMVFDGGGHSIYNGRFTSAYFARRRTGEKAYTDYTKYYNFFSNAPTSTPTGANNTFKNSANRIAVMNVNFSNIYLNRIGGVFGIGVNKMYLDNVNFLDSASYATSGNGSTMCFGFTYYDCFVNNSMVRNCHIYGTGHCGGFASYDNYDGHSFYNSATYIGDESASTNTNRYFTDIPDEEVAEIIWKDNNPSVTVDGTSYKCASDYPSIYKNSMVIDSEVYDIGGTHSGTFVSCGQGDIIYKNCFSNSTIYGLKLVGGFIGCDIGSSNGFYMNVEGEKTLVNMYFENCFFSGLVECSSLGGGFIGAIYYDYRSLNSNYRGQTVFKNCYSTGSIGMQFSAGEVLGGFAGIVCGNVGNPNTSDDLRPSGDERRHVFINCYAAGEVGGIETDSSVDDDNHISIGGFFGRYQYVETFEDLNTSNYLTYTEATKPYAKNCYYDMQTTAMRERDIGGYGPLVTDGESENLNHTLDEEGESTLTGLYTLSSTQKGVNGLAETSVSTLFENSKGWDNFYGYYPELTCFTNEDANSNFGEKADIARLYSRASVATVFLSHWDEYLSDKGEIEPCYDATIYDSIRNITQEFSFSSGGNSALGSIGWQANDKKNAAYNFSTYLGGDTTDENGNKTPVGFKVDYDYYNSSVKTDENKQGTVTKTFAPEVVDLVAELEDNDKRKDGVKEDYSFNCYDFAEGKQFIKVVTCTDDDYGIWKEEMDAYTAYLADIDVYNVARSDCMSLLGLEETTVTDADIAAALEARLKTLKGNDEGIADWLIETQAAAKTYLSNQKDKNSIDAFKDQFVSAVVENMTSSDLQALADEVSKYTVYPFKAPEEVAEPVDFESFMTGETGSRTLRIVPTSYFDAGDMVIINVSNDKDTNALTNSVTTTIGDTTVRTNCFDHSLGVLYSSTQGLQFTGLEQDAEDGTTSTVGALETRLGNSNYYVPQNLALNSEEYYEKTDNYRIFNNDKLNDGTLFALYDVYPTRKSKAMEGTDATGGLGDFTHQVLLGNYYSKGDTYLGGKTLVKVFHADVETDDDKNYSLEFGKEVDLTNKENLAKWSGEELFDADDTGYYYMVYYWRMNDRRYQEKYKLVTISANSFDVEMRTGVAGDTEDSFVYKTDSDSDSSDVYYTNIDCDILNPDYTDDTALGGTIARHNFPSDLYYYQRNNDGGYSNWTDYAKNNYDTYGEYLDYEEATYWYKGKSKTVDSTGVVVAWRKNADYALVKLLVEVEDNGTWKPMEIVTDSDTSGGTSHEVGSGVSYAYTYTSYSVTQNPKTKKYSIMSTSNVVKTFAVSDAEDSESGDGDTSAKIENGSVRYINFDFIDTGSGNGTRIMEYNDNIRVTALFREVEPDITAKETVLIDDGVTDTELVNDGNGGYIALDEAEEYRSVNNLDHNSEEVDYKSKKAVLFGDTLIFRKKVQNLGVYNANEIILKEEIPKGIDIDVSSIGGYVQGIEADSTSDNYGSHKELESRPITIYDTFEEFNNSVDYANKEYSCYYDENSRTIYYRIDPVRMDYDYYVYYKGKANEKYTVKTDQYNTHADYDYVFVNGDTVDSDTSDTDDDTDDDLNQYYAKNAIYNISCVTNEGTDDDGKEYIDYTVNIKKNENAKINYYIQRLYAAFDESYTAPTSGTITLYKSEGGSPIGDFDYISGGDEKYFIIKFYKNESEEQILKDGAYFTIRLQKDREADNTSFLSMQFLYSAEETSGSTFMNSFKTASAVTNKVEAQAVWLYLNCEKTIDEDDPTQDFLFKVMNYTTDAETGNTIYTDIKCAETDDGSYKGSRIVQTGERGFYDVTETAWANTDYDVSKAVYTSSDIDFVTGGEAYTITGISDNGVYLPRAEYKSTAFPLWSALTEDGETIVYPTITCTNTLSEYAWLSSQSSVENSFSYTAAGDTASETEKENPVTTEAVIADEAVVIKKEDSEE